MLIREESVLATAVAAPVREFTTSMQCAVIERAEKR